MTPQTWKEPKMTKMREICDWMVIILASLIPLAVVLIFIIGIICLLSPGACSMEKLATISRNPFIGDSTSNPFSLWNNPFYSKSPYNRFGPYGNRFSPYSANNQFATETPGIYGNADEGESSADAGSPEIYMPYGEGEYGDYH